MSETSELTREEKIERRATLHHLEQVWDEDRRKCPVCAGNNWTIGSVGQVTRRNDETHFYPLIPISCVTCGYTFLINERWVAGEFPADPPPDDEPT